ncbi:MAG: c-type cytochrome [Xanthomonadales bacterium]|nr:c-type cytochrome [Xanthomonadales bacterium]
MKQLLQFAIGLSLLISLPVFAIGDADAGQGKAAVCAACHGVDGNSMVPNWPKIAGQHAPYLQRQLILIRDGNRPVPEMAPIAANLSDQDMADLAAYFSGQTISAGLTDEALRASGELLYRGGNLETDIPACMSCHGPAGEGNPLSGYPNLAGQHSVYSEKMLTGYRAGTTWGADDANSNIMTGVANRLTDTEIKAVASYIQGLHSVKE